MKKKIVIILAMLTFLVVACQGFDLKKLQNRPYHPVPLSKELKERIKSDVSVMDDASSIVRYSCSLTAELLSFSGKNDILRGKANCIGYAQLSSTICNYAFSVFDGEDKSIRNCVARPVVGTVHYCGLNLNSLLQNILPQKHKSFFKDHDFMEVKFSGGDIIYVDACIYDYFGRNDL